jgi:dihydroorotase
VDETAKPMSVNMSDMSNRVLTGGRVIDPASKTDEITDVVIRDGMIEAVGQGLVAANPDLPVHDLSGYVVTPGLIDLHAHIAAGLGDFCLEADRVGVNAGVPTVIDGGTSGVATFGISRRYWDQPAVKTRVLAFLDPNQLYLATKDFICHKLEIANDLRNLDVDSALACVEENADIVIGLKVRACYVDDPKVSPFVEAAKQVAGPMPVMVHLGRFPFTPTIATSYLLNTLRGGDILTHAFRGASGVLDTDGRVTPEFRDAVDRGLLLDIGHSGTDFRFRDARKLFEQGYFPHSASTDLNVFSVDGPVYSLAETLSKVWALGVDLPDVIAMATTGPANAVHRESMLGAIEPGRSADLSVLEIVEGEALPLSDGFETITVEKKLASAGCYRTGEWYPAGADVLDEVVA